jgi:deoxyadenosine/deoxycytidine kinase
MERDYIDELNCAYEAYFSDHQHHTPVLVIDSNPLNFVTQPEDLKWVENRIRQALKLTPFQPELPLEPKY